MRILIVDDNEQMRRLIRSLVAGLSEECYECGDGREALQTFERHRPDCVLMDIEMGGTDGISATRAIKASFPDARVIIVTHYDDANFRNAAQEAGACGYIVKENLFDLRRLLATLDR